MLQYPLRSGWPSALRGALNGAERLGGADCAAATGASAPRERAVPRQSRAARVTKGTPRRTIAMEPKSNVVIEQCPLAGGVGFEPTVGSHLRRFSRPLP